jgi:hypothetical protein
MKARIASVDLPVLKLGSRESVTKTRVLVTLTMTQVLWGYDSSADYDSSAVGVLRSGKMIVDRDAILWGIIWCGVRSFAYTHISLG